MPTRMANARPATSEVCFKLCLPMPAKYTNSAPKLPLLTRPLTASRKRCALSSRHPSPVDTQERSYQLWVVMWSPVSSVLPRANHGERVNFVTHHPRPIGCARFPLTSRDCQVLPASPPSVCGILPVRQEENPFSLLHRLHPLVAVIRYPRYSNEPGQMRDSSVECGVDPRRRRSRIRCSSIPRDIATRDSSDSVTVRLLLPEELQYFGMGCEGCLVIFRGRP